MLSHNMFTKAMSIKGPFLGVCETIPVTFNVEASGYSCLVTLGLGLWLRFEFVPFCRWVS